MSNSVSAVHASEMKKAGSASAQDSVASLQFSNTIVAYTILRVSFGANIMLHGVSRLLAGHAAFLAYLNHYFEKAPIVPASILPAFAERAALGRDNAWAVTDPGTRHTGFVNCWGPGDHLLGYRHQSRPRLAGVGTAAHLRLSLLLPPRAF